MERIHLASEGPGLLLSQFITATVDQLDPASPARLTHRSVAALAARWCFVDAAHFSRVFRDRYGFPPSHARPVAPPPAAP